VVPIAVVSAVLFIILASPFVVTVHASTTWTVNVTASLGGYTSTTTLGIANDATDGFDTSYDQVVPPSPPTGVYSYFYYPNNPTSPDERRLSTSIIPPSGNMNWTLRVEPIGLDGAMVLNWTTLPVGYSVHIINATDLSVLADMTQVTQYSYSASDSVLVVFTLNFVIPELPMGPILVLAVCFASYGLFKTARKRF
jgi:hypothetical protein